MKKNLLSKVLLLSALALLSVACTKDRDSSQKKVAVLLPDASIIDRWATDKANLESVMGKYGFNATFYIAPETAEGAAQQVEAASWSIADGKKAMQDRLASYGEGECPDMVLAAIDNLAQGAIEALAEAGITDMPVITGQDNTVMAQKNIKDGKQAMTIDKNLKDMAYNTGMIVNSLIANSPVQASQTISNIPVFYSNLALVTIDSY